MTRRPAVEQTYPGTTPPLDLDPHDSMRGYTGRHRVVVPRLVKEGADVADFNVDGTLNGGSRLSGCRCSGGRVMCNSLPRRVRHE